MKKALIIGVNYYENQPLLSGCVRDASAVNDALSYHYNMEKNFDTNVLLAIDEKQSVTRKEILENIQKLFSEDSEIALLYFSGHGFADSRGGCILASDSQSETQGINFDTILSIINKSPAKNKIVVLDSCQSGMVGNPENSQLAIIKEGVTILTSSTKDQLSYEVNGSGIFTDLFVDALNGGAANLLGDVTPGSIYSHIDQSLGAWDQRPVFKTNVKKFVSLRKTKPSISKEDLRKIIEYFPEKGKEYMLDPTYEGETRGRRISDPEPNPANVEIFKVLQKYNRLNLLVPVDAEHMWSAAMESKSCKLTVLGEHYRRLVKERRI